MKPFSLLALTAAILLLTPCRGQKFFFGGPCDDRVSAPIAIATLTAGRWRIYASTHSIHDPFLRCAQITFTQVTANRAYSFVTSGINKVTGSAIRRTGIVTVGGGINGVANLARTGYLGFSYSDQFNTKDVRYYVIWANVRQATQMVLHACKNVLFGRIESALVLSRITLTAAEVANIAASGLGTIGASQKLLQRTFATNC